MVTVAACRVAMLPVLILWATLGWGEALANGSGKQTRGSGRQVIWGRIDPGAKRSARVGRQRTVYQLQVSPLNDLWSPPTKPKHTPTKPERTADWHLRRSTGWMAAFLVSTFACVLTIASTVRCRDVFWRNIVPLAVVPAIGTGLLMGFHLWKSHRVVDPSGCASGNCQRQ
jgi:hypothetical protein